MSATLSSSTVMENTARDTLDDLVALSAPPLIPSRENVRKLLSVRKIDWTKLLHMAESHRSMPLLIGRLNEAADLVPVEGSQVLRDAALQTFRTNTALASELLRVSAQFRSVRIPHLAYKGPALAQQLYGDVTARITSDLDILIPPSQIETARDTLIALGYRDKAGLSKSQQAASFRYGFEHSFCLRTGTTVDLHWRIVHPLVSRSLDMDGIWRRASWVNLLGQEVPTFGDEDLLAVLCLHAGQHEWAWLGGIADIAQLILTKPDIDWDVLCSHLGDSNTLRIVAVSLYLARNTWQVELPEGIMRLISTDGQAGAIADQIRSLIWPECRYPSSFRWAMERSRGTRWRDRVRFLSLFMNPTMADFTTFRVPSFLVSSYPLLRIFRLLRKYMRLPHVSAIGDGPRSRRRGHRP